MPNHFTPHFGLSLGSPSAVAGQGAASMWSIGVTFAGNLLYQAGIHMLGIMAGAVASEVERVVQHAVHDALKFLVHGIGSGFHTLFPETIAEDTVAPPPLTPADAPTGDDNPPADGWTEPAGEQPAASQEIVFTDAAAPAADSQSHIALHWTLLPPAAGSVPGGNGLPALAMGDSVSDFQTIDTDPGDSLEPPQPPAWLDDPLAQQSAEMVCITGCMDTEQAFGSGLAPIL